MSQCVPQEHAESYELVNEKPDMNGTGTREPVPLHEHPRYAENEVHAKHHLPTSCHHPAFGSAPGVLPTSCSWRSGSSAEAPR
mmetsp:Transcript_55523/g.104434  ORF Transcript_55523/g.104434 Transcript_55523/m.104434 type:complete len:83 (-) Transcript_55523:147-395(-)